MARDTQDLERRLTTLEVTMSAHRDQIGDLQEWREESERTIWRLLLGTVSAVGLAYLHVLAGKLGL
jgi:hypothetical protein